MSKLYSIMCFISLGGSLILMYSLDSFGTPEFESKFDLLFPIIIGAGVVGMLLQWQGKD